jgi:hypothetical protein
LYLQFNNQMTALEIQDYIHVYSVFSFRDGRKEPGICFNRYNIQEARIDYYFIPQINMHAYKNAYDRFEKENCQKLCILINPDELASIRPVSLSDYKVIMELLEERKLLVNLKM